MRQVVGSRMACGPNRVPGRCEVPPSNGAPTMTTSWRASASAPSAVRGTPAKVKSGPYMEGTISGSAMIRVLPSAMMVAMSLDDIDARIVTALISDARASYAVIGDEVGLSAPAVKRRVDRLRASGAITGFSARVDPAALGWTTEAYVELFCGGSTSPEEIGAAVRRHPEVADACTVTGDADALVHIRAADIRHFEQVVERIAAEPFVVRTRSVIVLSRLVERTASIAPHTR